MHPETDGQSHPTAPSLGTPPFPSACHCQNRLRGQASRVLRHRFSFTSGMLGASPRLDRVDLGLGMRRWATLPACRGGTAYSRLPSADWRRLRPLASATVVGPRLLHFFARRVFGAAGSPGRFRFDRPPGSAPRLPRAPPRRGRRHGPWQQLLLLELLEKNNPQGCGAKSEEKKNLVGDF